MAKTLGTETYTIGKLFGRYELRSVILPKFQRSYSWEKAQVLKFIEDLFLFENSFKQNPTTTSYFLGSMVLIENTTEILLLDGQQRLATATIILAAMRDEARRLDKPGFNKGNDLARDIQRELIEKDTEPITHSLILSELDEPYFLKAIKSDPPVRPNSKLRSNKLIQTAYDLAAQKIQERLKNKTLDDSITILKEFRDALSKGMTLVGIIVQNEDDAYTIFETLNDRGLRLSVPDLVLNLLMKRAANENARQIIRQHWNSMLRVLGRRDISRFLRHLWVSYYGDLKSEGLFAAITKELNDKPRTSASFAELCADECEKYVGIMDMNISLPTKAGRRNLEGIIKYLRLTAAPPLLLAGYRSLSENDFEKLLQSLIVTHIRFVLFANQNPADLETAIYDAARIIRERADDKQSSNKILNGAKARLKLLVVSDETIKAAAEDINLERNEAIWLMTMLANDRQSATKEVGMDKANLEHIFPQNPLVADWHNASELEELVWHIGNLTILGERINRNAQNKGFHQKLNLHYKKSEIEMTKDVLKYSSWTPATINARAKLLMTQASKLWPVLK